MKIGFFDVPKGGESLLNKTDLKKEVPHHYIMNKLTARKWGIALVVFGVLFGFLYPVIPTNPPINVGGLGILSLFIGMFLVFTNS